jgi:hypothetical protein
LAALVALTHGMKTHQDRNFRVIKWSLHHAPCMMKQWLSETGNMTDQSYNPNRLLDALIERMNVESDSGLSKKLKVAKHVIADMRRGNLHIGASMIMWMHEATGLSINELRSLLGDRRLKFRVARLIAKH